MKKRRGGRRSHLMLRSAGIDDTGVMTTQTSIPPCLKMWFPCTESGADTTITDIVGGAVYTPDTIAFGVSNAVTMTTTGLKALTSGAFPVIGTKSFILFQVYDGVATAGGSGTVRPESDIELSHAATSSDGSVKMFDGDGAQISKPGPVVLCGSETGVGMTMQNIGDHGIAGQAIVLDTVNHSMGNWLHNDYHGWVTDRWLENDYATTGEVFTRLIRNENYEVSQSGPNAYSYPSNLAPESIYGNWGRNDLGLPDAHIQGWQEYYGSSYPAGSPPDASYTHAPTESPGFTTMEDGVPGVWAYSPEYDIPAFNYMRLGTNLGAVAEVARYGIALFVFDNGLPSDFKEALRWMRDQWIAGNKVIWPNWVTQT